MLELSRLKSLLEQSTSKKDEFIDEVDVIKKLTAESIESLEDAAKAKDIKAALEAIDDLKQELGDGGSLEKLMKKSGALWHDMNLDDDNQTILSRIQGRMEQIAGEIKNESFKNVKHFKSEIEKLLDEVDIIITSGRKGREVKESLVRESSNAYDDSADFTEDFYKVTSLVREVEHILESPKMTKWMKITDRNFSTDCVSKFNDVIENLRALSESLDKLDEELNEAS